MNNFTKKPLTEGEILMLLMHRSGLKDSEVAEALNLHSSYLSRLKKSETLTRKVKIAVCEFFKVDISVFESSEEKNYLLPDLGKNEVMEPSGLYETEKEAQLAAENERMQIEVWKAKSMVYDLLLEKGLIDMEKISKIQ